MANENMTDALSAGSDGDFIRGIFKYCDRWCERCALSTRCGAFATEIQASGSGTDMLDSALEVAAQMLTTTTQDEAEYYTDAPIEEPVGARHAPDEYLSERARAYGRLVKQWFEDLAALSSESALVVEVEDIPPTLSEAVATIRWDQLIIITQVYRAVKGRAAADQDVDSVDRPQRDSDGCAKVALLSIDRSIAAWQLIRAHHPPCARTIRDIVRELITLRRAIEREFPEAREFIRPGFDESPARVLH